MRILIAPDKFKDSLGAREVALNIAAGLRDVLPDASIAIAPVADGGEGTADIICHALDGSWITCPVHDPLGRPIEARYAWIDERKLAVMEMSEAAGMRRLLPEERDPMRASTFGVGEMILDALGRGAKELMIGLGGSATNDGGFGMARALGFRFLADDEQELKGPVADLQRLARIVRPEDAGNPEPGAGLVKRRLGQAALQKITAAADVRNPLLGERGATRVFGPQKGAKGNEIEILERALARLADVVARDLRLDQREVAGAGAAGGLGFGLMSFCRARLLPGFDVVAQGIKLEDAIRETDVIVTGEGRLDLQTLEGKAPAGVARLGRKHGKRVYAIVGSSSCDSEIEDLFEKVLPLDGHFISQAECMKRALELLHERAGELAELLRRI